MSDTPKDAPAPAPPAPARRPLGHRLLVLGGVFVALVIAYFFGAATIPRWWAQRIGDQVDGSGTAGVGLGLFYGFVFTFVPLLVLSFALRRSRSWTLRGWLLGAAILLALPNLFTLGIVLGTGNAAHAGERILDVNAPYFRGASLVGAIVGVLGVLGVRYLLFSRRRARGREKDLREELTQTRDAAKAAPGETDKDSV